MTESSRTPDPVKIGVRRAREIEVDDHIDRFNVNTSSEEICAHQASCFSIAEVMVDPKYNVNSPENHLPVPIILLHFGVDKEAGVAKLRNLSCK